MEIRGLNAARPGRSLMRNAAPYCACDLVHRHDVHVLMQSRSKRTVTAAVHPQRSAEHAPTALLHCHRAAPRLQIEDPSKYGVVIIDEYGQVQRFVEKPKVSWWGGVHVLAAME